MPQQVLQNEVTTINLFRNILKYSVGDEKRISAVVDPAVVTADGNGRKTLPAGALMCRITASQAFGPHLPGATDGRQNITRGNAGILTQDIDCTDGPVDIGLFVGDAMFLTSALNLYGATVTAVQTALPTCEFY